MGLFLLDWLPFGLAQNKPTLPAVPRFLQISLETTMGFLTPPVLVQKGEAVL